MTPDQFCYWLQGKLENRDATDISVSEVEDIQAHLAIVFAKVTSNRNAMDIKEATEYVKGSRWPTASAHWGISPCHSGAMIC
jgi:hypothetical protein